MVRNYKPHETISLVGKVVLITGGSAGIGKVNVRQFAELGAKVYVVARNKEKTLTVLKNVAETTGNEQLFFLYGDLDSLNSIKQAATEFLKRENRLHILVCNAGAGTTGKPWTSDGFESKFGQNYLAHFLLTNLLLECLKKTAASLQNVSGSVRIINVSSDVSEVASSKFDFSSLQKPADTVTTTLSPRTLVEFTQYGRSKLCQVLATIKMAQILTGTGISVYAVHPGAIASDFYNPMLERGGIVGFATRIFKNIGTITEEEGSLTTLYCAVSDKVANESGLFYDDCERRKNKSKAVEDLDLIEELWEKSCEWTKGY
ncbi:hypothetical protein HK100_002822 [Physocladia obscura]|uniref:NAD(P)-binding protein n=1 Tax=Physocladia obscura TaxID=109957 RepID=A0AAD5SUX0_9FUNG|nr:hypothetical protein HK100_002822 [Physocladia obscura]